MARCHNIVCVVNYNLVLNSKFFNFQYHKPSEVSVPVSLDRLNDNIDVTVAQAERHYYNCHFRECLKTTTL